MFSKFEKILPDIIKLETILMALSNKNTPPNDFFQNFDYCPINYTLNFTLESMCSACFIKILWEVTLNLYKSFVEPSYIPSFYQNMIQNESFAADILTELIFSSRGYNSSNRAKWPASQSCEFCSLLLGYKYMYLQVNNFKIVHNCSISLHHTLIP